MNNLIDCGVANLAIAGSAISSYYGGGVVINYNTAAILTISGSAVTDKFIRIYVTSSYIYAQYSGSAGESGSALISPIEFGGTYGGTLSKTYFILCPNAIIVTSLFSSGQNHKNYLIGKLSDGQYIVAGLVGSTSYDRSCMVFNTTTGAQVRIIARIPAGIKTTTNKYLKTRLSFFDPVAGITLTSGSIPYMLGDIYVSSIDTTATAVYSGSGIFVTPSPSYVDDLSIELSPYVFNYGGIVIENIG